MFIKTIYLEIIRDPRNKMKTEILNISMIKKLDFHKIKGIYQKNILVRRVLMSLCTVSWFLKVFFLH